jgi:Uma2 family endonuclease
MAVQHDLFDEKISVEEYLAIVERDTEHGYEYLDGRVYMMTGGTPDHSIISSNLGRLLGNLLQGRRCIVYNSDVYFQLSENYRVCPDVTVSCDPRDRGAEEAISYPSLVAEVLSPTSEARDRGKKSLQYRSCPSIQEYLLISTESTTIELFRREKNGFWMLRTLGLTEAVELVSHGISFEVAQVYQNSSLVNED